MSLVQTQVCQRLKWGMARSFAVSQLRIAKWLFHWYDMRLLYSKQSITSQMQGSTDQFHFCGSFLLTWTHCMLTHLIFFQSYYWLKFYLHIKVINISKWFTLIKLSVRLFRKVLIGEVNSEPNSPRQARKMTVKYIWSWNLLKSVSLFAILAHTIK